MPQCIRRIRRSGTPSPMSSAEQVRVLYVVGTRPEVIRSARTLQIMAGRKDVDLHVLSTGQHYDHNMLKAFLTELDVPPPDHDLAIVERSGADQVGRIVSAVATVLRAIRPDAAVVFGDTNSSLGAALAASKLAVPLVHIEAGCRSFDMRMPEEINRRVIDQLAGLLLPVSDAGKENLRREGVLGDIEVVGDPLFDILVRRPEYEQRGNGAGKGLVTLHRAENVDDPELLESILRDLVVSAPDLEWVFPIHPRTQARLGARRIEGMQTIGPVGYGAMLELLASSQICVTDSGGLQKEAFWMRVPCVTVRPSTEWTETVAAGANALADPGSDLRTKIASAGAGQVDWDANPYGNGDASERVVDSVIAWIQSGGSKQWLPPVLPA